MLVVNPLTFSNVLVKVQHFQHLSVAPQRWRAHCPSSSEQMLPLMLRLDWVSQVKSSANRSIILWWYFLCMQLYCQLFLYCLSRFPTGSNGSVRALIDSTGLTLGYLPAETAPIHQACWKQEKKQMAGDGGSSEDPFCSKKHFSCQNNNCMIIWHEVELKCKFKAT